MKHFILLAILLSQAAVAQNFDCTWKSSADFPRLDWQIKPETALGLRGTRLTFRFTSDSGKKMSAELREARQPSGSANESRIFFPAAFPAKVLLSEKVALNAIVLHPNKEFTVRTLVTRQNAPQMPDAARGICR